MYSHLLSYTISCGSMGWQQITMYTIATVHMLLPSYFFKGLFTTYSLTITMGMVAELAITRD